jgi:hypothetical protein
MFFHLNSAIMLALRKTIRKKKHRVFPIINIHHLNWLGMHATSCCWCNHESRIIIKNIYPLRLFESNVYIDLLSKKMFASTFFWQIISFDPPSRLFTAYFNFLRAHYTTAYSGFELARTTCTSLSGVKTAVIPVIRRYLSKKSHT